MGELAILGGEPAFPAPLHVGSPNIPDRAQLHQMLDEILDRRWLTNHGPLVRQFEAAVAQHLGVKHVIATCNATVGLEILSRALGLTGEVIVPSWTFVATAHALRWQGIRPIFADVDPRSHTLDPLTIERLITPATTGIVGVHTWGNACDTDAIEAIARTHDLRVMYDAAHAFSCEGSRGRMIGNFGDGEVFSFHATKFVNTFEGGAIATNSEELAKTCRAMTNFGFSGLDQVDHLGINGKMAEPNAAMGLCGLESLHAVADRNIENRTAYAQALRGIPGLHVHEPITDRQHNNHYVVVEVDSTVAGLSRDALCASLWAENVRARRYFHPGVHQMTPYREEQPHAAMLLPETERLAESTMTLPTGLNVSADECRQVAARIGHIIAEADEVQNALSSRGWPHELSRNDDPRTRSHT